MRLMPEMPDYRTEPSPTPEGDGIAASRWSAWADDNLDPIVDLEPGEHYGFDSLVEDDRDRMVARTIQESELIGFWVAWHRAGGFAELERGGWDRSTIFRKVRRFRSYFGIHPDNARFPWLVPDWNRCWESDRLTTMYWARQRSHPESHSHGSDSESWLPCWAPVWPDPHDLEGRDVLDEVAAKKGEPGPIQANLERRRCQPAAVASE